MRQINGMYKPVGLLIVILFSVYQGLGASEGSRVRVPSIINKRFNPNEVVPLELAQRFVTLIRLPEAIEEIVLGDPARFKVENTERNIYVKPIVPDEAQTNLFVLTKSRQLITLFLRTGREGSVAHERDPGNASVGLVYVLSYASLPGSFIVPIRTRNEADLLRMGMAARLGTGPPDQPEDRSLAGTRRAPLLETLFREERARPCAKLDGEKLKGCLVNVTEQDDLVYILFRLRNGSERVMQLLEPQVLLESDTRKGRIFRRTVLGSADILPARGLHLEKKRIDPGEEIDGIIAVERPAAMESTQRMALAVSESLAADKPLRIVVPLGQNVLESTREEVRDHVSK